MLKIIVMGLIKNIAVYPIRMPEGGDTVLGTKSNENGKSVVYTVESIASLVLSTLIGDIFGADTFTYTNDNVFVLSESAFKVTMVFIENGAYPDQVPVGNVDEVTVDENLLLSGQTVVIHYIKLG